MEEIIPSNEYTVVDNTAYANPQVALDEGNKFIDNYRAVQADNTAQIASDTQKLGTNVPTAQGGLTGAGSYFTSRYQTPQINSAIADIRATIQAKALNDVLSNEQAYWQKQYSDAYNAAQKRANAGTTGTTGTADTTSSSSEGEVVFEEPDATSTASSKGTLNLPAGSGNITMVQVDDELQYTNNDTGEVVVTDLNGNFKRRNVQAFLEQQRKLIREGK